MLTKCDWGIAHGEPVVTRITFGKSSVLLPI
jgi:hypothetical protein